MKISTQKTSKKTNKTKAPHEPEKDPEPIDLRGLDEDLEENSGEQSDEPGDLSGLDETSEEETMEEEASNKNQE